MKWTSHEDELVSQIVTNWNAIVLKYENQSIKFAVILEELLKSYPEETAKQIIYRVKKHQDLKPTISVDRIYQGWRLVKNRPDIAKYVLEYSSQQLQELPSDMRPILKSDGSVAVEHYFELYKRPGQIDEGMKIQLENSAKTGNWTVKQLKEEIFNITNKQTDVDIIERSKKGSLIKSILAVCKPLNSKELEQVKDFVMNIRN